MYGTTTKNYIIKTNDTRYLINGAPRLYIGRGVSDNQLRFRITDGNGIQSLTIYDKNKNNKEKLIQTNATSTKILPIINLEDYTANKGNYQLKVRIKDNTGLVMTKVIKITLKGTGINSAGLSWVGFGEFKNNKPEGYASLTWTDGHKYVGEWKDSKKHGRGTYTWPNGDKYVGEFKDGDRNGSGTFTYANGTHKTGIWKNNELVQETT